MGILPGRIGYARHCNDAYRHHDRRKPQTRLRGCAGFAAGLILAAASAIAEPIRIATFNTELSQSGPGLLLRNILRKTDQVSHVVHTIKNHTPDVLVLQSIDYDSNGAAVGALADYMASLGVEYPYTYSPEPNTGIPTGFDIDGDGRSNAPRDAQGYGRFPGQGGIAVFSRYAIGKDDVQNFTKVLWTDVSPSDLGKMLPSGASKVQRLASVAMVAIPIELEDQRIWLLTHHATPPVFDGPEDRNGHRNADENRFWIKQLEGGFLNEPYVLAAQLNIDPDRGEGHHDAVSDLLGSQLFTDPMRNWPPGDIHTVTFAGPGPGPLRVNYVLPSPVFVTLQAGMAPDLPPEKDRSRHRLLWVDLELAP